MDTKNPEDRSVRRRKKEWILLLGLLLLAGVLWWNRKELREITSLNRPEAGTDSREVELEIQLGGKDETWNWKGSVAARVYSAAELEERMELATEYILTNLPREGETLEQVVGGVDLIKQVPDADVQVTWNWEERELLDREGNVIQEALLEETILILTAELRCQELVEWIDIPIRLVPVILSEKEQQRLELEEQLTQLAEMEQESSVLVLPDQWQGVPISYTITEERMYWIFPLLLGCALLFLRVHQQEEIREREKERKEQILLQYPDFVSRFVVLLGAGMNVSSVWMRLAGEYDRNITDDERKESDALGKEVCQVARSLRNGEQERQAYEAFGRRTGVQACKRFITILNQNLRMGTEHILEQLEYEAAQALEDRKAQARRRGEEMGTKLLMPMLMQLVLILVMVMMPAFMNMS